MSHRTSRLLLEWSALLSGTAAPAGPFSEALRALETAEIRVKKTYGKVAFLVPYGTGSYSQSAPTESDLMW